jgi:hypothetical protein
MAFNTLTLEFVRVSVDVKQNGVSVDPTSWNVRDVGTLAVK